MESYSYTLEQNSPAHIDTTKYHVNTQRETITYRI